MKTESVDLALADNSMAKRKPISYRERWLDGSIELDGSLKFHELDFFFFERFCLYCRDPRPLVGTPSLRYVQAKAVS